EFSDDGKDAFDIAEIHQHVGCRHQVGELAASGADIAFSVEDAGEGDGFHLAPSLRYAHSESYVRMLLARHGLEIIKTVKS
ncbi:SAM-dependent methyltransferase, partial [Rhizobium johnstonii]